MRYYIKFKAVFAVLLVLGFMASALRAGQRYESMRVYKSERFPLEIKTSLPEERAKEALFRAESVIAEFLRRHPGFPVKPESHFTILWSSNFNNLKAQISEEEKVVHVGVSKVLEEQWSNLAEVTLSGFLYATCGEAGLPAVLHAMETGSVGPVAKDTGTGFASLFNAKSVKEFKDFSRFIHAMEMESEKEAGSVSGETPSLFGWNVHYFQYYLQYSPEARSLRDAIDRMLIDAANGKSVIEKWAEFVAKNADAITAGAAAMAEDSSADILSQHLEASARSWVGLAYYAEKAGKRYENFGDLVMAAEKEELPFPAEVPRSFIKSAVMFRDRSSAYALKWKENLPMVTLVSPEKLGIEATIRIEDGMAVSQTSRFFPDESQLSRVPDKTTNPMHSDHFLLFTDADEKAVAVIALHADLFYEECVKTVPWQLPQNKTRWPLYYYGKAWEVGLSSMNFYLPARGATWVAPIGLHTLQHEIFHQFVDLTCKGQFSWWFNEAIAEYYGHSEYAGDSFVMNVRTPSNIERAKKFWEKANQKMTLEKLLDITHAEWGGTEIYPAAWSIVSFLFNGDAQDKDAIVSYLRKVAANEGTAAERSGVFHRYILSRKSAWQEYYRNLPKTVDRQILVGANLRAILYGAGCAEEAGLSINNLGDFVKVARRNEVQWPADRRKRLTSSATSKLFRFWTWKPSEEWNLTKTEHGMNLTCKLIDSGVMIEGKMESIGKPISITYTELSSEELAALIAKNSWRSGGKASKAALDKAEFKPMPASFPNGGAFKPVPASSPDGDALKSTPKSSGGDKFKPMPPSFPSTGPEEEGPQLSLLDLILLLLLDERVPRLPGTTSWSAPSQ